MILLPALPKNSLGIIKTIDTKDITKARMESSGFIIGTKVKLRKIENNNVIIEAYVYGKKERINILVEDALKISVSPI